MAKIRFQMIGGFLGAGKTTTISRLARHYIDQGRRVGIVTNDQATDLVDTHLLQRQGFRVREVPGACFCCNFEELLDTVGKLRDQDPPDLVLAEPVGSCTDLVATVLQPLKQLYGTQFTIGPYAVILKPSHGLRILRKQEHGGFSPKAAYIFEKQLEEADCILINRIDELPAAQVNELAGLVDQAVPNIPVLRISAKQGSGFDELRLFLEQDGAFGCRLLELDYDTYAAGEAELGWLNCSVRLTAEQPFDLDTLLVDLVNQLRVRLNEATAETAHLKVIGMSEGFFGVANLVSSASPVELSLPAHSEVTQVDLIVNARVATDPVLLETHVRTIVASTSASRHANPEFRQTQSFRPGRPVPTHRVAQTM